MSDTKKEHKSIQELAVPELYDRFYVQKGDERRELFGLLADEFRPERGLYAGSFVHIAASFYIPDMVYVDSDRRMKGFFSDPAVLNYVEQNRVYSQEPRIAAIQQDFGEPLDVREESFDVLLSQYSGFVSLHCKQYLKPGGLLIANDSHGDASLAWFDDDFRFWGVIEREGHGWRLVREGPGIFFCKAKGFVPDRERVLKRMKGEVFSGRAWSCVFIKNR